MKSAVILLNAQSAVNSGVHDILHCQTRRFLPHGEESITRKLKDVTAVRQYFLNHSPDVRVQDLREFGRTTAPSLCISLAKLRKP